MDRSLVPEKYQVLPDSELKVFQDIFDSIRVSNPNYESCRREPKNDFERYTFIPKIKYGHTIEINLLQPLNLPPSIKDLSMLEKVRVDGKYSEDVFTLPDELFELKKLKKIYFVHYNLESIPKEIINLSNLETLIMADGSITEIPFELTMMSKLDYINLDGNKITYIPEHIIESFYKQGKKICIDYQFTSLRFHLSKWSCENYTILNNKYCIKGSTIHKINDVLTRDEILVGFANLYASGEYYMKDLEALGGFDELFIKLLITNMDNKRFMSRVKGLFNDTDRLISNYINDSCNGVKSLLIKIKEKLEEYNVVKQKHFEIKL